MSTVINDYTTAVVSADAFEFVEEADTLSEDLEALNLISSGLAHLKTTVDQNLSTVVEAMKSTKLWVSSVKNEITDMKHEIAEMKNGINEIKVFAREG